MFRLKGVCTGPGWQENIEYTPGPVDKLRLPRRLVCSAVRKDRSLEIQASQANMDLGLYSKTTGKSVKEGG